VQQALHLSPPCRRAGAQPSKRGGRTEVRAIGILGGQHDLETMRPDVLKGTVE
jgi:hypothetical protein